jgi:hypothetical protein
MIRKKSVIPMTCHDHLSHNDVIPKKTKLE